MSVASGNTKYIDLLLSYVDDSDMNKVLFEKNEFGKTIFDIAFEQGILSSIEELMYWCDKDDDMYSRLTKTKENISKMKKKLKKKLKKTVQSVSEGKCTTVLPDLDEVYVDSDVSSNDQRLESGAICQETQAETVCCVQPESRGFNCYYKKNELNSLRKETDGLYNELLILMDDEVVSKDVVLSYFGKMKYVINQHYRKAIVCKSFIHKPSLLSAIRTRDVWRLRNMALLIDEYNIKISKDELSDLLVVISINTKTLSEQQVANKSSGIDRLSEEILRDIHTYIKQNLESLYPEIDISQWGFDPVEAIQKIKASFQQDYFLGTLTGNWCSQQGHVLTDLSHTLRPGQERDNFKKQADASYNAAKEISIVRYYKKELGYVPARLKKKSTWGRLGRGYKK